MKRALAFAFGCALLASACSSSAASVNGSVDSRPPLRVELDTSSYNQPTEVVVNKAEQILDVLTVEQKIGQLFIPVVAGSSATELSADERASNAAVFGFETPEEIIDEYHLGGVMYLAQNVAEASEAKTLTSELQEGSPVPMLIAIDQEGGRVNRITEGVTVAPSAAELSGDAVEVEDASNLTATQVSALGVNVVLAPVGDLSAADDPGVIGNRSFGEDPTQTAEMVAAAVDGLQRGGVAAAVKHWPGHGDTDVDSHESKPFVQVSKDEWEEREKVPFEAAIDKGVQIVLVGHLSFPDFAPDDRVATVSNFLVDDLLRSELAYEGVVMTDALNMGAVADISQSELGVQSLEAGIDMLLYPENLEEMHAGVVGAVESGRISEERLDQSVRRVLTLKASLGLFDDISPEEVVANSLPSSDEEPDGDVEEGDSDPVDAGDQRAQSSPPADEPEGQASTTTVPPPAPPAPPAPSTSGPTTTVVAAE